MLRYIKIKMPEGQNNVKSGGRGGGGEWEY